MPRVRQTFTNRLPEPLIIWVEMECWCWVLQPLERFTAEFDAAGFGGDFEPLPIEITFDGEAADRLVMLTLYNQGETEPSFFIGDEPLLVGGELTAYGRARWVNESPKET